jgi:hypothetical protein
MRDCALDPGDHYAKSETNEANASFEAVVYDLLTGQYHEPVRVVALNISGGWSHDVSEDIARVLVKGAVEADRQLDSGTRRFVAWNFGPSDFFRQKRQTSTV